MDRLFGTAGIRGATNVEITPELALKIGRAHGDLLAKTRGGKCSVAVGHDTRNGAEMLARAAASGLASAGCDVRFYGCTPSGVLSYNITRKRHDGGLMITGSHMPPDRIGILIVLDDGACAPFSFTDR
ncbi:MAG: phosphoglucosamine mutase, partial [Planctomycetota bacterium]